MIRWGVSYLNAEGDRVLFGAAQGRRLYDSRAECQAWIDAARENSPHQLRSLLLVSEVSTLAPARFDCWDHGDPKGRWALECDAPDLHDDELWRARR